jgi:hypothetical protein
MRTDYINIGPAPSGEMPIQVGADNYSELSRAECKRFIKLICKIHGDPPEGAKLIIKSFPHDFGSYLEVCAQYEEGNQKATDYAFLCESETPEYWSD